MNLFVLYLLDSKSHSSTVQYTPIKPLLNAYEYPRLISVMYGMR